MRGKVECVCVSLQCEHGRYHWSLGLVCVWLTTWEMHHLCVVCLQMSAMCAKEGVGSHLFKGGRYGEESRTCSVR